VGVSKVSNVALQEIAIDTRAEHGAAVVAQISAFTDRDATVAAHLTGFREVAGAVTGVKLAEKQIGIPAGGSARVDFPVSAEMAAYSVKIEPSSRAGEENLDALLEDDLAFVSASEGGSQLTVVTSAPQAAESLQRLPAVSLSFITPEQYQASPPSGGVALFHRTVPADLPAINSVFILPPPGSQLGGELVRGQAIPITRWREGHPLLSYLNIPLLNLKTLVPLQRPGWAEELIASSYGTVAFAGEYGGHRYVALGFDLLPFGGRRDALGSVLLLNILKWLSGATLSAGYEVAPYRIPTSDGSAPGIIREARYIAAASPQGLEGKGAERVAPVPGLLSLGSAAKRSVRAVDFFSDEESNTRNLPTIDVPESIPPTEPSERGADSLMHILVWLVLGVLAVESVIALVAPHIAQRMGMR
jgi:hypothetical protein